jgi:hypothetical protein
MASKKTRSVFCYNKFHCFSNEYCSVGSVGLRKEKQESFPAGTKVVSKHFGNTGVDRRGHGCWSWFSGE